MKPIAMNEFCPLFSVEFSAGCDPPSVKPLGIITWLCESGKAGYFVHNLLEGFPQWMTLCRLEEALVDNKQNKGFLFLVGSVESEPEIQGWLEYEDYVIIPYGPKMQEGGDQLGVWTRSDFDELDYSWDALCPAADDSGMMLNQMLKESGSNRYPLGA